MKRIAARLNLNVIALLLLAIVLSTLISCKDDASKPSSENKKQPKKIEAVIEIKNDFQHTVDSLLPSAKNFIRSHRYNDAVVFIADLSVHSGIERLAIVDLLKDSIVGAGLMAHGAGGRYWSKQARYSNVPNSLCSSPGKYKVGVKYNGRFGTAYKLHGLDSTNSKAFERFIVLHAYDCVPDKAMYPDYLCNSEGCPMVSYEFLKVLSKYIDSSRKPILLWILG